MLLALRHLLSVLLLPATVTVFVPLWMVRRSGVGLVAALRAAPLVPQLAGVAVLAVGLALFGSSLYRFVVHGRGTLAPWDPPRKLVVRGPYRYVRHPMISGVVIILFGEALLLGSRAHGGWALLFLVINMIYLPLLEEPMLVSRFGDDYLEYRRHVPALFPRIPPWTPPT